MLFRSVWDGKPSAHQACVWSAGRGGRKSARGRGAAVVGMVAVSSAASGVRLARAASSPAAARLVVGAARLGTAHPPLGGVVGWWVTANLPAHPSCDRSGYGLPAGPADRTETTFASGAKVLVNYADTASEVAPGQVVPPRDFLVLGA